MLSVNTGGYLGGGNASGTLSNHLLFSPTNTYDIGASAGTRPRTIYAGTTVICPEVNTGDSNALYLGINNAQSWFISGSQHMLPNGDNAFDVGASATYRCRSGYFATSVVAPVFGGTTLATAIRCSLATPGTPGEGDWWIDASGVSPARTIALKCYDGAAARTVASLTY